MTVCCVTRVVARHTRIYGYVTDSDNRGIELANVFARCGQQEGTSTNRNGYYELVVECEDTVQLEFSMLGYATVRQRLIRPNEVVNVNVELTTESEWLQEVEVRGIQHQQGTLDRIDASAARIMPDATGGSIESILITFAGVNQNNELSSQYNVRGGAFDENSVYVNNIEIHRPLLIRSGKRKNSASISIMISDAASVHSL